MNTLELLIPQLADPTYDPAPGHSLTGRLTLALATITVGILAAGIGGWVGISLGLHLAAR